ncbi:hypothetical protein EJ06DRAFT_405483 [Trichodelitschia bisporula]|uniref:Signal recognition particle subunit SRP72 n=1 Tax=Trichodelitschia bisporula TaxID=703511 RepID=A0A6G1HXV9_9PEZI|nr:hypothetical protein EJ06DRAFT_405483 [Trichodelitschia bisporula]
MATTVPELSALFRQTHLHSNNEDILKAANAALKKAKTDVVAQQARVVALLKLDRFADALRAFDEAGDALKQHAQLEYSYALYKAGDLEKALDVAGQAAATGEGDRGAKHVLAQTSYRLEKFDRAASVYSQLEGPSARAMGEENDLRINSVAVDAQLEWQGNGHLVKRKKPQKEDLEAFESAYNAACASISRGSLLEGQVLLQRAKDLCTASEDLPEDEKRAELLPILTQQLYVLIQQGRNEQAARLFETIELSGIPDLSTRQIARINGLVVSPGTDNPFMVQRLFEHSEPLPKNDLLFEYQSSLVRQDQYTLDLRSLKYKGVASSTSRYLSSHPSPTTSAVVNSVSTLNTAACAQGETGKSALKFILPLLEQRPNDVGLLLTILQLYLLTNNHSSAINLLEKFLTRLEESDTSQSLDVRYAPGLVATLISLYSLQGRKTHIRRELAKAAAYWRSQQGSPSDPLLHPNLFKAAGAALLESDVPEDAETALAIFTSLHEQISSDRANTAGLVASLATTNPTAVTLDLLAALTPAARLVADLDAAALESAGVARTAPTSSVETAVKKRPAEGKDKTVKKRIRASRMPKEFVEGKKMDPERWLPLRERSYWKPKGRKGKARAAGLTQGGPVAEDKPVVEKAGVVGPGSGAGAKKKKKGKR